MRIILVGLGALGQGLLHHLDAREGHLLDAYGLRMKIVAALDTSGAVVRPSGIEPSVLLKSKHGREGLSSLQPWFRPGRRALEIIHTVDADTIVEVTPTNILDGEPAMSHIRGALKARRHVVTANKGPIVLAMHYLASLAEEQGVMLRFSGTVGGGTPMLDLARVNLRGDRVTKIEGIVNGTTNFILTRMGEGLEFDEALLEAQKHGYAEANPEYDVKGIDAGIKLAILANWTMGAKLRVTDVSTQGIDHLTRSEVKRARDQGKVIKLVASYDGERASVEPRHLPIEDPLNVSGVLNAVTYTTEQVGPITLIGKGAGGRETAAALLRDLIDIHLRTR
ncbi:MAG TPA: homoserine dehydrogenase [Thermoplasmata archaeon]|nr:homoserine dehydrogenase [Thermoplasmata archaeon]